jgi:hypothetical protein
MPNPPAASFASAATVANPNGERMRLTAPADDAVFIAEENVGIDRWNGSAIALDFPQATVSDVWGDAPDDVWAVGLSGRTWHRDATAWSEVPNPASSLHPLRALWGIASNDVLAAGDGGVFLHWDGSSWSSLPPSLPIMPTSPDRTVVPTGLFAASDSDVWLVGMYAGSGGPAALQHWDGSAWTQYTRVAGAWAASSAGTTPREPLFAVWGSGPHDVWIAGSADAGHLAHFDGAAWTDVALPGLPAAATLAGLWGACASDVWLVGSTLGPYDPAAASYTFVGAVYHFDGSAWTAMNAPADQLGAVAGGPTRVWVTGHRTLWSASR